ncbi:GyrI-like domain-containing protein [Leucobacter celer]|uniref:GyrI-like domain-containing protein n=1 Tax=Leucobacter celer TaxID=668625 RepID=UPI0006A7DD75|nr:GyrI-like domain-containing protein [Leucobacter celer]
MTSSAAPKIDFKKELDAYRAKRGEFRTIEMPPTRYLMIDGHGDPNGSPEFSEAIESLYPLAYAMKFASKRELGRDYVVPPLEGLWWADDMAAFTTARDKAEWDWTLMLMAPDWLEHEAFVSAVERVRRKGGAPRLDEVRFDVLSEGRCVQTLHVGSFDDEGAVLHRMHHEIIPDQGMRMAGTHHEIYLSDFRRVAPEKQRTILRQPVAG